MSQESAIVLLGVLVCGVIVAVAALLVGRKPKPSRAKRSRPSKRTEERVPDGDNSGLRPRPRRPLSELTIQALDPDAVLEDEDDDEITVVRVDLESSGVHGAPQAVAHLFVEDAGAEVDEPTGDHSTILTSAAVQSDVGRRRRRNDDRFLKLDSHHVFAVADGMGGYAGGGIAAQIAVDTLANSFKRQQFNAVITSDHELPVRASQLVRAVQDANLAVHQRGQAEAWLQQMGTTMVAARFAPRKSRLYIAHVGDSRCYRLRAGELKQLTIDHTLGSETDLSADDPVAGCLSRAIGVAPRLTIDVIIAKPLPGDIYLLSSDGLFGMIGEDAAIAELLTGRSAADAARALVATANDRGGRDNITALVVRVDPISESQTVGISASA